MVVDQTQLYSYDLKATKPIKHEIEEDRLGKICDIQLNSTSKFFVIGIPETNSFGFFSFDHKTFES